MDFLQEVISNSWGWILSIGFVMIVIAVVVFQIIKALIAKVIAVLLIPIAGLSGGVIDTVSDYAEDAKDAGVGVYKYISDYAQDHKLEK